MTVDFSSISWKPAFFTLPGKVVSATWLDDGSAVNVQQHEGEVAVRPGAYRYGTNLVVRVAKMVIET